MRSMGSAAFGITVVSFLSFFLVGQTHPFGLAEARAQGRGLELISARSDIGVTADCTVEDASLGVPRSCAIASPEGGVAGRLLEFLESYARALREAALSAVSAIRQSALDSLNDAVAATSPQPTDADETSGASPSDGPAGALADAVDEAVAGIHEEARREVETAIDRALASLPAQLESAKDGASSPADGIRAAAQEQVASTLAQVRTQTTAPVVEPAMQQSSSKLDTIAPSSTNQSPPTDPGCSVQRESGDTWSRSTVQCYEHKVTADGGSITSVTTATSSVGSASTSGDGVP